MHCSFLVTMCGQLMMHPIIRWAKADNRLASRKSTAACLQNQAGPTAFSTAINVSHQANSCPFSIGSLPYHVVLAHVPSTRPNTAPSNTASAQNIKHGCSCIIQHTVPCRVMQPSC